MALVTQPLRSEHQELLPHVEQLRSIADGVGDLSGEELWQGVDDAYRFLSEQLVPHATAEEAALYPVVARLMGAPEATATMSRDHKEVARLAEELSHLRSRLAVTPDSFADATDLRRVLYGLYALLKVHFAKEEEIYLPILDARLSEAEARAMFDAMEQAAADARHTPRR